jgi:hypothetical protein
MALKRTPLLLLVLLAVLLCNVSSGRGQSISVNGVSSDPQIPTLQRLSEPAGASRCQFCHRSEVEGYARSAMAHSLRRAGREPDGTVDAPDTVSGIHGRLRLDRIFTAVRLPLLRGKPLGESGTLFLSVDAGSWRYWSVRLIEPPASLHQYSRAQPSGKATQVVRPLQQIPQFNASSCPSVTRGNNGTVLLLSLEATL